MMKKSILALLPALALIAATSAQAQTTNIYSNAYSGGTIGSGTTSLITNGATITGDITDNGNLLFMQSSAITNTRSLTGNGMVTQSGTGTTVLNPTGLNAINNFAGGFTVNRGLLDITATASTTSFANATVNGGVLNMTANLTSMTNLTVNSGRVNLNGTYNNSASAPITIGSGTLSLNKQDVFGTWEANIATPITINAGGVLQNGTNSANNGYVYNTLGAVTLNGGTIQSLGTNGNNSSGTAFGLKGAVSVTGSGTSTITGAGFALGEAAVTSTTFDVANGATLNVTGNLVNGDDASAFLYAGWGNKHPSSLIKTNGGTMILSGTNTYTGSTTLGESGGTLVFATTNSFYNGNTTNWTASKVYVGYDATLAFGVGGEGQFSTSNITTILTGNLLSNTNGGFQSGSSIGLDVSGGNFTLTNNLRDGTNGSLGLSVRGANTLTVTGSNSYTGYTTINSGSTLQVGTASTAGRIVSSSFIENRGTLMVTNGTLVSTDARLGHGSGVAGTAVVSSNGSWSNSNSLYVGSGGGTGSLTIDGGALSSKHTLIGGGGGTFGTVTINSGTWSNSGIIDLGAAATSGSGSVTINGGSVYSVGGRINGGSVNVNAGTWTNSGDLSVGYNSGTNTASLILNGGSVSFDRGYIGNWFTAGSVTVNAGILSNSGVFNVGFVNGVGFLNMSGTGTVSVGGGTGTITLGGYNINSSGTLNLGNGGSSVGTLLASGVNGGAGTATVNVNSTGNNTLDEKFSGSLKFNQIGTGTTILTGSNSYTGVTTITAGTLQVGNGGASGTIGSGTVSNNGSLVFNRSDSLSVAAPITGSGAVSQVGTGTTTLGAANTYTGLTKVSAGTLALGAGGSLATNSSAQIDTGAKFDLSTRNQSLNDVKANGTIAGSGTMTVTGTLSGSGTVAADTVVTGTHSPGNSPGIQTFGGNLTYNAGAGILLQFTANTTNNSPVNYDQILVGNNLNFNGLTTLNLDFGDTGSVVDWNNAFWQSSQSWMLYSVSGTTAGFGNLTLNTTNWTDASGDLFGNVLSGGTFSLAQNGNNVVLNYAVPEPSTYVLFGLGALALVIAYRRKSQQAGS